MRYLFLAVLLLAVSAIPAAARLSGGGCQIYFGDDDSTPPEILEALNRGQGIAIRKCSDSKGYDLIFPPSRHLLGVCQAARRVLVKQAESLELMRWEGKEPGFPDLLMMVADGDCPRQDDPRYLVTENVTVGTFKAAVWLWEKASSDEKSFGALLAELHKNDDVVRFCGGLEKFESDFRRGKLKLTSVRFQDDANHTSPYIRLDLGNDYFFWTLLADFKDDQLVVVRLGCIMQ